MATLESQIQAVIAFANETTGKGDTHLGDAIKSLVDGYGGEGGGEVVEGEYTLATANFIFNIDLPEGKGTPDIISVECLEDYVESSAYTPRAVYALIRPIELMTTGTIGIGVVKGFNGNNDWYGGGPVSSIQSNFSLVLTDTYFQMYSSNSARRWLAGKYRYRFYYGQGDNDLARMRAEVAQQLRDNKLWIERDDASHEVKWYENGTLVSSETDFAGQTTIVKTFNAPTFVTFGTNAGGLASNAYITKIKALPCPVINRGVEFSGFTICTEFPTLEFAYLGLYAFKENKAIKRMSVYGSCSNTYQLFFNNTAIEYIDLRFVTWARGNAVSAQFLGNSRASVIRLGEDFFYQTNLYQMINQTSNWTHDSMIESLYTNQLNRNKNFVITVQLNANAKARLSEEEKAKIAELGIIIS